jgi:hypothetical protein
MSQDGVIAGDLAVMGIESSCRPLDFHSRGKNTSVEVEGQEPQAQVLDALQNQLKVEAGQAGHGFPRELFQPPAQSPFIRKMFEARESTHQRIPIQEPHVTKPSTASQKKRQEHADHGREGIVSSQLDSPEGFSELGVEEHVPKETAEDLKAGVGGQSFISELNSKISIDATRQTAFSLSHWEWVLLFRLLFVSYNRKNTWGAHFQCSSLDSDQILRRIGASIILLSS